MADKITIDIDARELLRALDQLGAEAERHVLDAARVTGKRIAAEAKARVARATGETLRAITVEEKDGAVQVFVGRTSHPAALPAWLEFGTQKMGARPFLFASARLEEGSHLRRVREALQGAIRELGF